MVADVHPVHAGLDTGSVHLSNTKTCNFLQELNGGTCITKTLGSTTMYVSNAAVTEGENSETAERTHCFSVLVGLKTLLLSLGANLISRTMSLLCSH